MHSINTVTVCTRYKIGDNTNTHFFFLILVQKALIYYQVLLYNRQTLTSWLDNVCDRNLACAVLIRHKTLSEGEVRSDTVIQQTDFDVTIGQCV